MAQSDARRPGSKASELTEVKRPFPPRSVLDLTVAAFEPAQDVEIWARETFIDEDAVLRNDDHAHLRHAHIGFLWTNVANSRHARTVVGQCEPGIPRAMGKWSKAKVELQLLGWFGCEPDFLITLSAPYAAQCGDAEFCALVEHELYHAGQEQDDYGAPKFRKSGEPAFAMRGHDVEEFVGIVRRYGVGAGAGETLALVEAARNAPEISAASLNAACGTCERSLRLA